MLRLGAFYFKPLPTVVTLLAIAFLVKLGFWQLERAEQKQALFADFAAAQEHPTDLNNLPEGSLPQRFSKVSAEGVFDQDRYLLRDNQMHNGKVGYQVIAFLQVQSDDASLPVNLGWVPAPVLRSELPDVEIPAGRRQLEGYFYLPDDNAFTLQQQRFTDISWPLRIQQPEFRRLAEATGIPLRPYMVLLSEQAEFGFERQWEPQVMSPQKHQAYALQWFSLALACGIIFIIACRQKKNNKERA